MGTHVLMGNFTINAWKPQQNQQIGLELNFSEGVEFFRDGSRCHKPQPPTGPTRTRMRLHLSIFQDRAPGCHPETSRNPENVQPCPAMSSSTVVQHPPPATPMIKCEDLRG